MYLTPLFQEHLIVFTDGCAENDACHAFKTMYPLLSFRPLSADVEHVDSGVRRQNT